MSRKRYMRSAYKTKMEFNEQGNPLCRWCKQIVQPPKRTFCSDDCIHSWKLRTSGSYMRGCVRKRDKEICAICKLDCKKLRIELRQLYHTDKPAWEKRIEDLKIPKHRRFRSLWDADHLIPVCEGGGLCGLENVRTLCWACHRGQTNQLLARRRAAKKAARPTAKKTSKKNVKHTTSNHSG